MPHTADAGLFAAAPDLPSLFEEAAAALASLIADLGPTERPPAWEAVELTAGDLPGLAYAWLNELVTLGDLHHAAIAAATVDAIEEPAGAPSTGRWLLRGRVGLLSYASGGARASRHVKSATYHRLEVRRCGRRWTMTAYVDI